MTTVQDCLREVIGQGPNYFIRSSVLAGAQKTSEWEPAALLADMLHESPGVLEDHAWTEWTTIPGGTSSCYIHYGFSGSSLSHREVPGYGHLRALELSQKTRASTDDSPATLALTRQLGF